jgi:hyperosmotically inducible periplasmic protein
MNRGMSRMLFTVLAGAFAVFAQSTNARPDRISPRLAEQVRHELVMMPYYGVFDHISFKLQGRKVVLLGDVSRPTLKDEAERRVKSLEGVEGVDNRINVLPLSPYDDRIRLASYRAIYSNPGLNRYAWGPLPQIHLIVRNGTLTLRGRVDNEADRNLAGILATGVPGVFEVKNQLIVQRG